MARFPDVALIIQGPMKDKSKVAFHNQIEYYKELFDEIILSTYTEHANEEVYNFCYNNSIQLIMQTENIGNLNYKYNIGQQTLSTLEGLRRTTKKYAIKHRTDECYSNLDKLINLLLEDDEKWVSGSTIFGPRSYYKYHAADHLFTGKTDKLIKTFELTKKDLENKTFFSNHDGDPAAEVTFTMNFIRTSGDDPRDDNDRELMAKWFNFVPDIELYPFIIRFNHDRGSTYTQPHEGSHISRHVRTMADVLA